MTNDGGGGRGLGGWRGEELGFHVDGFGVGEFEDEAGGGGDIGFGHDDAAAGAEDALGFGEEGEGMGDVVQNVLHEDVVHGVVGKRELGGVAGEITVGRGDDVGGDEGDGGVAGGGGVVAEEFAEVAGAAADFEEEGGERMTNDHGSTELAAG